MNEDLPRRIALRYITGSLVPLVGCAGSRQRTRTPNPETEEPDSTDEIITLTVGDDYETEDGVTYVVEDVHVQRQIRTNSIGSSTHWDVAWLGGSQFAVVDSNLPTPDDGLNYSLAVDGRTYPRAGQQWYWSMPVDYWNPPGNPTFPAPITDAEDAAIVWSREEKPTVRWRLSPATIRELNRPPEYEISSFDVPDSVSEGESFKATFTVENTSEYDGRFLFEFGAGPVSDFGEEALTLAAGATRTYEEVFEADWKYLDDLPVVLDYGKQRIEHQVTVT